MCCRKKDRSQNMDTKSSTIQSADHSWIQLVCAFHVRRFVVSGETAASVARTFRNRRFFFVFRTTTSARTQTQNLTYTYKHLTAIAAQVTAREICVFVVGVLVLCVQCVCVCVFSASDAQVKARAFVFSRPPCNSLFVCL